MTPCIASLYSCALRKPLRLARENISGKFACFLLGLFVSVPVFAAEGANISADAFYSDDVTLTTFDGDPLDINGDGFVDLAVASDQGDEESRWYPGNNDGTFGAPVLLQIGASSEILGLDLDGDAFIDLVQGRRDVTSLFYLNIDSTGVNFADDQPITADTNRVLAVAAGDLDGDGDLDLVTGTGHAGGEAGAGTGELQVNRFYVNNGIPAEGGAPTFTGGDISATDRDDTRSIALADIDGDTKLDVIAGNDETTPGGSLIYLNTTSAADTVSFAAGVSFGPEDDQASKVLVGDLNNDGKPDIVVLNFIASRDGTVVSPGINRFFLNASLAGAVDMGEPHDVSADANMSSGGALADFDGDGDLDLAVANLVAGAGQTSRNRLYLNQFVENGDGTVTFAPGTDIAIDEHQSRELAAGDVDTDGDIDIVVGNEPFDSDNDGTDDVPGNDRIYLNNGTADPFGDSPPPDRGDNAPPAFTSTAVTQATPGAAYTYAITASDDDGDAITIAAAQDLPGWLTLTDNLDGTATLSGTPAAEDVGDHAVSIQASDGTDATTQDFTITVSETPAGNTPPEFTSTAVTAAAEGEAYSYDITATDADSGATLTITAPTLPGWLTFTDNGDGTATLSGTPAAGDVGEHAVSLEVSDGTDTAVQDFTITVEAASSEPPPSEPPPDNGGDDGGGGGSLGFWSLIALIGFGTAARRRRIR
ncbi:MAG TPA: FG-GAP-like repeat-containing protein [Woeseiaceae bacterium]|nr:FG-GAP-like repeat-containing protein [Woeseiaceae bacterium]